MTQLQQLQEIIKQHPYLAWDTTQYDKLSAESIVERVLNYGDWKLYQQVEAILGIQTLSEMFHTMINRPRVNVRKHAAHYFQKYFEKYA